MKFITQGKYLLGVYMLVIDLITALSSIFRHRVNSFPNASNQCEVTC